MENVITVWWSKMGGGRQQDPSEGSCSRQQCGDGDKMDDEAVWVHLTQRNTHR